MDNKIHPPAAIGYVRSDISGPRQSLDETEIRRLAVDIGYPLAGIVRHDGGSVDYPMLRLRNAAANATRVYGVHIAAVLTPSLAHLGGNTDPMEWCDEVYTADSATASPFAGRGET
ncbi:hypothetical protein [Nocardia sp. GAS34]|uniref:hypothetical protein n=1 Tax=unclassified Nocardia TaxID=2637762 RepID=UPI003D1A83C1